VSSKTLKQEQQLMDVLAEDDDNDDQDESEAEQEEIITK